MQIQLIDYLPTPSDNNISCDLDALACAGSRDPVVVIADRDGVSRLRRVGIDPVAVVTPSRYTPMRTKHRLERVLKRIGATTVVCRSGWVHELTSKLSGFTPILPDDLRPALVPDATRRRTLRSELGIAADQKLLIPLANRPEEIDSLVICMCASAMSIANVPLVMIMPSRAIHIDRARAFMCNADRILNIIVTDVPSADLALAADALVWGPHVIDADPGLRARESILWAQRAGVPVLCPSQYIHLDTEDIDLGRLHACNGTGAADLAAPLLSIFGSNE